MACDFFNCEYSVWGPYNNQPFSRLVAFLDNDPTLDNSPAQADALSFAHHADLVAYWIARDPGELWISDLSFQNPRLLYRDTAHTLKVESGGYVLSLLWSPDDKHLIIDLATATVGQPKLIYHIDSSQVEEWRWDCDRVALSPRTNRLATWCHSSSRPDDYAVIEWGGEIWVSPIGPAHEVVRGGRLPAPSYLPIPNQPWAWSPDGQSLAYFESEQADAMLQIIDSSGRRITATPSRNRDVSPTQFFASGDLQWSQDGRRVLVNASGSKADPCPMVPAEVDGSGTLLEAYCWQIVEVQNGNVVWSISDSAEEIMALRGESADRIGHWLASNASISPDGKLVAIRLESGTDQFGAITNIETGATYIFQPAGQVIRWGVSPSETPLETP